MSDQFDSTIVAAVLPHVDLGTGASIAAERNVPTDNFMARVLSARVAVAPATRTHIGNVAYGAAKQAAPPRGIPR